MQRDKRSARQKPSATFKSIPILLFPSIFFAALFFAPRKALWALWWRLLGKRQRAGNLLIAVTATDPRHYQTFIAKREPALSRRAAVASSEDRVDLIAVIVPGPDSGPPEIAASAASIAAAFGPKVTVHMISAPNSKPHDLRANDPIGKTLARLAETNSQQWVLVVFAGDTINRNAAPILRQGLGPTPETSVVYWDEDCVLDDMRREPWIKPQWDELLHFARDCLAGASALRLEAAVQAASGLDETSGIDGWTVLTTRLAKQSKPAPFHLPYIITHRKGRRVPSPLAARASLLSALWKETITLDPLPGNPEWAIATLTQPEIWPGVSIIIPTKDLAQVLDACLKSLQGLIYPGPVEIIIVDNGSTDAEAISLLSSLKSSGWARVLEAPGPFNFSALINRAADDATHPILCLLNNDVEAIDGDWLTRMVVHAVRPGTGAVGAQLIYPDGAIQHAGVVIGIGGAAGHFAKGTLPLTSLHPAWFGVCRKVSAVTAACLLVRKEHFLAVGGFDADNFQVAFNDVDFCMKLREAGLSNVYVAEAQLIHHESKSRGRDIAPAKAARFAREEAALKSRWDADRWEDPCFSPLFSLRLETIAFALWDDHART